MDATMKRYWRKILLVYLAFSLSLLTFRVVTEVFQRYSVSSVRDDFLLGVDDYCTQNGLNWQYPKYWGRYHYWSKFRDLILLKKSGETIARLNGDFESRGFKVYLTRVQIAPPYHGTSFIDITNDFLSGTTKLPDIYFAQNPLPKPLSEYLHTDASNEDFISYLMKNAREADAEREKNKSSSRKYYWSSLTNILLMIESLIGVVYCVWTGWLTLYSWYLFIRTKKIVPLSVRIKSYFYLMALLLILGLTITSAVSADPLYTTMPRGFYYFYTPNMMLIFVGLILYLIESALICKQYKGIYLSAKTSPDDNPGNGKL